MFNPPAFEYNRDDDDDNQYAMEEMLRGWRINTTKQKPGPGEQQMTFTLYLKCACHRCPAAAKIITIKEKDQPWTDDASNINDGILCSAQFFTGWQEHMLHRSRSEELRYLFGPN